MTLQELQKQMLQLSASDRWQLVQALLESLRAARLFERMDTGEIEGFIAATTITNIYYIVRRAAGREVAQDAIAQHVPKRSCMAVRPLFE